VKIEERLGFVLSKGVAQGIIVDGGKGRVVVVVRGRGREIGRGALPGGAVEGGAKAGISRVALRLCRGGFALCFCRAGESSVASGLLGAHIRRGRRPAVGVEGGGVLHRQLSSTKGARWIGAWAAR
jgi:hypothetical protein